MKKVLALAVLALAFSMSNAQVSPSWPQGAAAVVSLNAGATNNITVGNNKMNYVLSIPTLTTNTTLSVTATSSIKAGTILMVIVKTTATETTTFAGAIIAPVVTGVAGKTWSQSFIYNGGSFYPTGAKIQVD
jgi:hypothetical protein